MIRRVIFVLAIWPTLTAIAADEQPRTATRNVVLVTSDGLRWQDVFRGADPALLNQPDGGVSDVEAIRREYWRETPEARRETLMPFLWTVVARRGQLYGNADKASPAKVANGINLSYPGYNEMFTGSPDPRIDSNDKRPNPNVTVFEWLNRRPGYRGKVERGRVVGRLPVHPERRAERPVHQRGLCAVRQPHAHRMPGPPESADSPVDANMGRPPGRRLHLPGCPGASPARCPAGVLHRPDRHR